MLCSCPTWVCCRTFHVVCIFLKPKPAIVCVPHQTLCPFSSLLSIHLFSSNVQCFPFVGYFPTLGYKFCENVVSASSRSCLLHVEQSLPHRCSVSISLMHEWQVQVRGHLRTGPVGPSSQPWHHTPELHTHVNVALIPTARPFPTLYMLILFLLFISK